MTITTYTDREIALRQQLAAATQLAQLNGEIAAELKVDKLALEAAIEASKLFAAPVIAPDVLKDAERYRAIRDALINDDSAFIHRVTAGIPEYETVISPEVADAAFDAAMGGV